MNRFIKITFVAVACVTLSGCDLLEGVHQTSPTYRNPLPFSTPWREAMKIRIKKRELERVKQDWGLYKAKKTFILMP
jgi:hypothetical protein